LFTVSPIDIDRISEIVTLGNLNPPGHVFPTDHIYFYLARPDPGGAPDIVPLYAPGSLTVTRIRASNHVTAGFTDYSIILRPCEEITVVFGHVSSLSADLFGDITSYDDWRLLNEYATGGETYRLWEKDYDIRVTAGEVLGTTGGNTGIWAWDFGVYDQRHSQENVASPYRWQNSPVLQAVCPLIYYEEGPVLDQLISLVHRDKVEGEKIPCGSVLQDIPGTAQGAWFLLGTNETYPEDPHLALVRSNHHPEQPVFSVGISIPNLQSGTYVYLPESQGLLNRDFRNITPDGRVYGFQINRLTGVIIVGMPDIETLWIEVLVDATADSTTWTFTENKTVFKR